MLAAEVVPAEYIYSGLCCGININTAEIQITYSNSSQIEINVENLTGLFEKT